MLAETHFKTPTLVVHSQLDYRLDVSEGYQLFDTLQRMKVPSKMLYFPDEGHWVHEATELAALVQDGERLGRPVDPYDFAATRMTRPPSESAARRGICNLVVLLAFAGTIKAQPTAPQASAVPASQPSASPTARIPPPASAYAGDAVCATCHEERAKTFFATPHYLDSSLPSKKTILGNFTPGKNVLRTPNPDLIFAMIAADDGFFQSAVDIRDPQNLTGRAEKFDVVVGSGRHGQTYLYWKGDELFELPVSYWTWTHAWINSPGYPDGERAFQPAHRTAVPGMPYELVQIDGAWPHANSRRAGTAPPDNRYGGTAWCSRSVASGVTGLDASMWSGSVARTHRRTARRRLQS